MLKQTLLASALAIGLVACGGMNAQEIAQLTLTTAWGTYQGYCGNNKDANGCSQANEAIAKQSYSIASKAIDDWAAGAITQQQAEVLIKKAVKLFTQLQS